MLKLNTLLKSLALLVCLSVGLTGCAFLPNGKIAGLSIVTDSDATVTINGEDGGSTPYSNRELKPGKYQVLITPDSETLVKREQSIELNGGTVSVIDWTFGATEQESSGVSVEVTQLNKKSESAISVASIPDGAIVKINDASEGFTPVLLKTITPGSHEVSLTLPGYKEIIYDINVLEGYQTNISAKLAKDISAATQDEAEIASDSAQPETTPAPTAKASVAPKNSVTQKPSTTPKPTSAATTDSTLKILETGTGWLRVRETASTGSKELAKVDVGEEFPFTDKQNGWYQITYEATASGWVSGQFVEEL